MLKYDIISCNYIFSNIQTIYYDKQLKFLFQRIKSLLIYSKTLKYQKIFNYLYINIIQYIILQIFFASFILQIDCNIKVIARKRKFIQRETAEQSSDIVRIYKDSRQVVLLNPKTKDINGNQVNEDQLEQKTFAYDNVFDENSTNEELYIESGKQTVDNLFQGYNSTMFAYGQTGSGKTYSIQGDGISNLGMCYRALKDIFDRIEQSTDKTVYLIKCSFFEIYNEKIKDLLDNKGQISLVTVKNETQLVNLSTHNISSYQQAIQLYEKGQLNRSTAATAMNQQSSRSHSIFQIMVEQQTPLEQNEAKATVKKGTLSFVDLAGSEKLSRTQATGKTMQEGNFINLSLSTLKTVIKQLIEKKQFISYRDSVLTRILSNSLGGNAKTLMLICISPASSNYDESYSTLQYGMFAQKVTNKAKINEDVKDSEIRKLKEKNEQLQKQIDALIKSGMNPEQVAMLQKQLQMAQDSENQKIINVNTEEVQKLEGILADYKQQLEAKERQHKKEINQKDETILALNQRLQKLEEEQRLRQQEEENQKIQQQQQNRRQQINKFQQTLDYFSNMQKYYFKINKKQLNKAIVKELIIIAQKKIYETQQQLFKNVQESSYSRGQSRQSPQTQSAISMISYPQSIFNQDPGLQYSQSQPIVSYKNPYQKYGKPQASYPKQDQDVQGFTQAMRVAQKKQIPGEQLFHDPKLQNKQKDTVATWLAGNSIIPPMMWYHDPEIANQYGETVALLLCDKGIIPPQQWMHSIKLKDNFDSTIESILHKHKLPVPLEWQDEKLSIFDQACYGKIPELGNHMPDEQNEEGWTVAMILAAVGVQIPEQWYHNANIKNCYGQTVIDILRLKQKEEEIQKFESFKNVKRDQYGNTMAMLIANEGKRIPQQYYHDPEIRNNDGWTVALILASKGIEPDACWNHNKYWRARAQLGNKGYKKAKHYTVQNFLEIQHLFVPEQWKYQNNAQNENSSAIQQAKQGNIPEMDEYGPDYQNMAGTTVALELSRQAKIPPQQWIHNPYLREWTGNTVAMNLAHQGILPPKEWIHDPRMQNDKQQTVALIIANTQIPPKEWYHNPEIQDYQGQTVAIKLASIGLNISEEWQHDPKIKDKRGETVAMLQALENKIPSTCWEHEPELHNNYGRTVATYLLNNNTMPPVQWMYNTNLKFCNYLSLKQILQDKKWPIPSHFDKYELDQFDQAIFDQLQDEDFEPGKQNEEGWTVAMIMVKVYSIIPISKFEHDPNIKNKYGQTVADLLQEKHKPVPNAWYDSKYQNKAKNNSIIENAIYGFTISENDDPSQQNCDGFTVAMCYASGNYSIESEWCHKPEIQNKYGDTVAMIQSFGGIEIEKEWYHNPTLQNKDGNTVAMLRYKFGVFGLDDYWCHSPTLQNEHGDTVAMISANYRQQYSEQWYHDPLLKNNDGDTVGIILARKDSIPSRQWMHDIDIKNKKGESIKSLLEAQGQIYYNGAFTFQ